MGAGRAAAHRSHPEGLAALRHAGVLAAEAARALLLRRQPLALAHAPAHPDGPAYTDRDHLKSGTATDFVNVCFRPIADMRRTERRKHFPTRLNRVSGYFSLLSASQTS